MSEQDIEQILTLQRPITSNRYDWKVYWEKQGQPWRTEPEIDIERQKYLAERRNTEPDFQRDIFPFSDIKLNRADIEWLLVTHENGRGPVDSRDESQRRRKGLDLRDADLSHAFLRFLPLGGTLLHNTHLENADLFYVHLENADIINAHMEGANLNGAHLEGANLNNTFFNSATRLDGVTLSDEKFGAAKFTDIHWGDTNLAVIDWSTVSESGYESTAHILENSKIAKTDLRSQDMLKGSYSLAARAYRQLSVVLRNQGVTEVAARFAYRAQLMQRKVFWHERKFGRYFFSLFLDLLAGYGFKAWRSFAAYLIVITAFATVYFIIGHTIGPVLSPLGSVVFSMTSFHGRGFFPGGIGLDDPLTVFAALEAFVGLLGHVHCNINTTIIWEVEREICVINQEHLEILGQGVKAWNKWREEHPDIMPILLGANLSDLNLKGINFSATYLVEAFLAAANLSGANLSGAFLSRANLRGTDLSDADLKGAHLSGATLINTNLSGATLVGCSVYGIAAWGVRLEGTIQENLLITNYGEPAITVDNLEVAQFVYLLLNHKKLRDVFNAVTERGVLILGRFGGDGLEVLQAIAAKLREERYLPIIFDFERPQDRNFTETVKTLAGLSRFIIADLSGPSVPQELYATVPHFKIPFVPIIEAGRKPFAMAVDILEYPWVVRPPVTFATIEELLEQLATKVIAPAEEKHQARQKLLDELFGKS